MEKLGEELSALPRGAPEADFLDRLRHTLREWADAEEEITGPPATVQETTQETGAGPLEGAAAAGNLPDTGSKAYTLQYAAYLDRLRAQAARARELLIHG